MRPAPCTRWLALFLLSSAGCTSYRYAIAPAIAPPGGPSTQPMDDMPSEVVKDRDLVIPAAPARLRLRQLESRCVLLIENPTDAEVTLDGQGSAIVDPLGQTRSIATQLIPPGAFTKLILPPLRDAPPTGPAFQFGIGVLAAGDAPRRSVMLDVGRAQDYWEWDDVGRIRIILSLKQNGQVFRHDYFLARSKR